MERVEVGREEDRKEVEGKCRGGKGRVWERREKVEWLERKRMGRKG